jgi:hypothetical protein
VTEERHRVAGCDGSRLSVRLEQRHRVVPVKEGWEKSVA